MVLIMAKRPNRRCSIAAILGANPWPEVVSLLSHHHDPLPGVFPSCTVRPLYPLNHKKACLSPELEGLPGRMALLLAL